MQVVLLENTRFHAEEEACDPAFTAALAALGSIFVNDAFGVCHRDQSSVSGLARSMRRCYPGLLVRREVQYLSGMLSAMKRCATLCTPLSTREPEVLLQNRAEVAIAPARDSREHSRRASASLLCWCSGRLR